MIHYMNVILILLLLLLLFNTISIKEGVRVKELDIGKGVIPDVPYDAACMILYSMGVKIDRMQYLKNKCQGPTNNKNEDNSNICRA